MFFAISGTDYRRNRKKNPQWYFWVQNVTGKNGIGSLELDDLSGFLLPLHYKYLGMVRLKHK